MHDYCTNIYTLLTIKYYNGGDNKMANLRRLKNDIATMDKREEADKVKSDNRNRNDALTQERRFEADKTMNEKRTKNDEITADRRVIRDAISTIVA